MLAIYSSLSIIYSAWNVHQLQKHTIDTHSILVLLVHLRSLFYEQDWNCRWSWTKWV